MQPVMYYVLSSLLTNSMLRQSTDAFNFLLFLCSLRGRKLLFIFPRVLNIEIVFCYEVSLLHAFKSSSMPNS